MDKLELDDRVARLERRVSILSVLLAVVVAGALGAAILMTARLGPSYEVATPATLAVTTTTVRPSTPAPLEFEAELRKARQMQLQGLITRGDRVFQAALKSAMPRIGAMPLPQATRALQPLWQERDAAIAEIAARFVTHPWPVDFLMIVSPLVTWIWLGAMIIAIGGLIALWPVPALVRRRRSPARSPLPVAPPAPAPVLEGAGALASREPV